MTDEHPRFVTIGYFIHDMLGYKSRVSYYNHLGDKGWPQRVYPDGKPLLVYDECVAYQRSLMGKRDPVQRKPMKVRKRAHSSSVTESPQ